MNAVTFALLILALGVLIVGVALAFLHNCGKRSKNAPSSDDSSVFVGGLGPTDIGSSGHHHGGGSDSSHGGFDGGGGHGGH
jgi:hypothetical protein